MNSQTYRANGLLLLTALIWGTGFVAQRLGLDAVGPMLYNGLRFALGALIILPLALRPDHRSTSQRLSARSALAGSMLAGIILFTAASLQQFGLLYTSVANAGFITGLYVIIVPLLGLLLGHRSDACAWLGAVLAVAGMYLLSMTGASAIAFGDFLQLAGALFWAVHVLVLDALAPRTHAIRLACLQFLMCSLLCLLAAVLTEPIAWTAILAAAPAVTYGGVLSVGIAYTLQVVAQKDASAAHAAIIMSLEAVFAALAGWLVLGETLGNRALLGCTLMLAGMLVAQLLPLYRARRVAATMDLPTP